MLFIWRFNEYKFLIYTILLCLAYQSFELCWSLSDEGLALLRFKERIESDPFGALSNWKIGVGEDNHCCWYGVGCSNTNVVELNLKNLCLKGTLSPDLGNLVHLKSMILSNNSFFGIIPEEIGNLKELERLDLGLNNFRGPLMQIKLRNTGKAGKAGHRKLLIKSDYFRVPHFPRRNIDGKKASSPPSSSPSPSPSPSSSPSPSISIFPFPDPYSPPSPGPSPSPTSPTILTSPVRSNSSSSGHGALVLSAAIGGPLLLILFGCVLFFTQSKKVSSVKPWATGLSGQLQKAFVTGVPKLKRSEIEAACEDFSNVIGSLSVGTLYKGTLSSGVEIAVVSLAVESIKDWSKNLESQFRKKIDTLSKVNHKNFVNLLGFCEEEKPFTRMIVFEYAPNGTLFEHLHIKEAEHLDWATRMRIAMGMSYCLEHMHQLTPPLVHRNLNSSSAVYLTEDYAAKVSDFAFLNEKHCAAEMEPSLQSNVYSFGVLLFEMITGKLPFMSATNSNEDWASDYLQTSEKHLEQIVDPTLESFQEEQLVKLDELIKMCVNPDPGLRPIMKEVTARLRDITTIGPDGAIPKVSPLWWAELEILSTEVN